MNVALAVLISLSASVLSQTLQGETPAEDVEVARERPGLQNLELGILRQLLFELLALKQLRPPEGTENISFQEITSKLWKGLLRMQDRLWQLAIDTNIMPESVQDTGELAGPHGMLAWESAGSRVTVLRPAAAGARLPELQS
ncbi:PXM16 [Symbiodinium sp. CCMP2592]|nr:PXM16 [Symbiodinium sp. CCMP2592]